MDLFFLIIYAGNLLNYIDRGIVATLLPLFATEFSLTKLEQGVLAASFMIGYATFSIVFSALSSRVNKRSLLTVATGLWCLSCLGMASAQSKVTLFLARCISGIGEAAYQSIVPALLAETYGDERSTRKMSIFYTAINIGFALGILIGGCFTSWRVIYLVEAVGGVFVIIALHYFYTVPESTDPNSLATAKLNLGERQKIKSIITNPVWWFGTIGSMLVTYTFGVVSIWIPSYYKEQFSDEMPYNMQSALLAVTLLVSGTVGSIGAFRLLERKGKELRTLFTMCQKGCLLCLPCILASVLLTQRLVVSVVFLAIALAIFAGMTIANGLITVTSVPVEVRSYSTSLCILIMHLGGDMPSPIVSSWIWQQTHSLRDALLISSSTLFIAALVYWRGKFRVRAISERQLEYQQMTDENLEYTSL